MSTIITAVFPRLPRYYRHRCSSLPQIFSNFLRLWSLLLVLLCLNSTTSIIPSVHLRAGHPDYNWLSTISTMGSGWVVSKILGLDWVELGLFRWCFCLRLRCKYTCKPQAASYEHVGWNLQDPAAFTVTDWLNCCSTFVLTGYV